MKEKYLADIRSYAASLGCLAIAQHVIDDPDFQFQSGSSYKIAHHYGEGGLLKHVWEVIDLCKMVAKFYMFDHEIEHRVLFLAALFHDYGKVWDYDYDEETKTFVASSHRRLIHHITRSVIEWERVCSSIGVDQSIRDAVTHCILSHHGKREYGSPVAPYSREAWILHLCDSISARVDDCDRLDMVKIRKY